MKKDEYDDIVKTVKEFKGFSKDCAKMLVEKYTSVNKYALLSILAIEVLQRMKREHRFIFGEKTDYYERFTKALQSGKPKGILLNLAKEIKAPPALLARHILKQHLIEIGENNSPPVVSKLLKDTTLIPEKELAYEIYLCVLYDDQYGPIADSIALSVGQEYEVKLQCYLKERNIPFRNEDHLRTRGYDKTPDVKLEVPIAVNGHVINWIESKARFGNEDIHRKYIKEQFLSYWNRFGPGLVIYWFGFLDTLSQSSEKRFIIMDHFPKEITYMNPSSVEALTL